jgi:hypothetical protein
MVEPVETRTAKQILYFLTAFGKCQILLTPKSVHWSLAKSEDDKFAEG